MFRWFGRVFFRGLLVVLPVLLTVYLTIWLIVSLESMIGRGIRLVLPEGWYVPGMGMITGLVLIFLVGLLWGAAIFRKLWGWMEKLLDRLPVIKTLFGAFRDLTRYFSSEQRSQYDRVVLVDVMGNGMKLMGLVTRQSFDDLPDELGAEGKVMVYFPMSYQVGGYALLLDRDKLEPIDMGMEDAMRFLFTAGVTAEAENPIANQGQDKNKDERETSESAEPPSQSTP